MDAKSYLTPKEVSKILSVDKRTVHRLCKKPVEEGGIPAIRVGRQFRIPADFETTMHEKQQPSPSA